MPENFNPFCAYLQHPDGTIFQVLNEAGDEWDEAATFAAYNDYVLIHGTGR